MAEQVATRLPALPGGSAENRAAGSFTAWYSAPQSLPVFRPDRIRERHITCQPVKSWPMLADRQDDDQCWDVKKFIQGCLNNLVSGLVGRGEHW